jgi:hypothetical protein
MLLNRRLSALSRSDANRFLDRKNEYPAIVDAPCSRLANGMNVVGIDPYFQQSILGAMIIVSVALTFDRSKTPVIK